jgi:hypothetical protein
MLVRAMILLAIVLTPGALMAQGTLERIAKRSEFRIGYDPDARPLSYVETASRRATPSISASV